ncbi:MAG: putative glycoside hydrolase [Candidatus Pacebacteria bacterium]|nr:putative glycoside hydrolase [Candidatus Paceibacterota bacterium]MCF7856920.1 putative glycoside hydrolase [Candidatus Paceibacterota bacterium]
MKWMSVAGIVGGGFYILSYVTLPQLTALEYSSPQNFEPTEIVQEEIKQVEQKDEREIILHEPLPEAVRAIYMTSCVAGTTDFRNRLVSLIDDTEINAVVIDIKDYSGTISFPPLSEAWKSAWTDAKCGTRDMKEFIHTLHEKGIFVIGRITVFQDPFYTKIRPELAVTKASDGSVWHDRKGLSFIDVGSHEYWDHIVELSSDAYNIGFDELNFDYVRYPSDGNMQDIAFPNSLKSEYGADKQANLEAFFKYLNEQLDVESKFSEYKHENTGRASTTPWTSVDLFGMTTTNFDDLSIGQVQDRAAPYFDFVAPMVYPSHYPNSFLGLGNPNDYPYKVVNYVMQAGVNRMISSTTPMQGFLHERIGTSTPALYKKPVYTAEKFRTWIQDFDYGGDYDATDVRNQIQASYDAGVKSFMIWAPSNIYTRGALNVE